MTFAQLHYFIAGVKERELEQWRHTRMIMWSAIAPNSKKKLRPEQILKLPGDVKKGRQLSADEYNALKSKWYSKAGKA